MRFAWWQFMLMGYLLGSAVTTLCVWLNERAYRKHGIQKENPSPVEQEPPA